MSQKRAPEKGGKGWSSLVEPDSGFTGSDWVGLSADPAEAQRAASAYKYLAHHCRALFGKPDCLDTELLGDPDLLWWRMKWLAMACTCTVLGGALRSPL